MKWYIEGDSSMKAKTLSITKDASVMSDVQRQILDIIGFQPENSIYLPILEVKMGMSVDDFIIDLMDLEDNDLMYHVPPKDMARLSNSMIFRCELSDWGIQYVTSSTLKNKEN
jgi:hypothetical protein